MKQEFVTRQQALLAQMQDNSIAVLGAALEVTRSRDTEFPFRQNSDFHYLCGFPEPDAVLVLEKVQGKGSVTLYCREKDKVAEIWQGRRVGAQAAPERYAVDQAFELNQMPEKLRDQLNTKAALYWAQGETPHLDEHILVALEALRAGPKRGWSAPETFIDWRNLLGGQRLIKSPWEVAQMQKAADISVDAHKRAMGFTRAGVNEYQVEAELHHEFARQGARHPAYGSIVGGGDNACILHYTENQDELKAGDLLLIDAGAEYQGYAADITRTFPVSGTFSPPQAELYQLVLEVQEACIAEVKPGNSLKQVGDLAIRLLTQGCIELGLLKGELNTLIKDNAVREFYMHGIGHWLGLDVHDVGDYSNKGAKRGFEPGMVLTIEPGLYIAPDAKVDEKWRGIGIRIEDNILVTAEGNVNLTAAAPKTIQEIESLMAKRHA